MHMQIELKHKLEEAFNEKQAELLSVAITDAYNDLAKSADFRELKGIVKELAETQKELGKTMGELAEAQKESKHELVKLDQTMGELAETQKELGKTMGELAETQKELGKTMGELAEAQKDTNKEIQKLTMGMSDTSKEIQKLTMGMSDTRSEVGGLGRSMGYALENEAYRMLPNILKEKYGISLHEKLIRKELGNTEINILGKATTNQEKEVMVVGEAKLRLSIKGERNSSVFTELEEKVEVLKRESPNVEVVKVLITHFATQGFLQEAKKRGVIVIQSFEWE
ncbi:MAG: hypothetical protein V1872_05390 [bacterium]